MSILIVDDSQHIQRLLKAFLEPVWYTDVLTAASARDAFKHLGIDNQGGGAPEVDLILMDVTMPEMDGVEACRRIKATPEVQDIPIIMVTAHDEATYLDEAFAAGAMDYITKPVNKIELRARVRSALTLKRELDSRKLASSRLEEKNREWRKLSQAVEQSPSTVMITDTQNYIQYVNPKFSQVTGYTFEEAVGQTSGLLESGEATPEESAQMSETIASGKEWHGECLKRKKNGETYWASESIAPILDLQGEITHIVTLGEDITERKVLQERLNQSQRMESIGQLAGGIAHDFNNLLSVISGYTSILLSKSTTEPETADQLREIDRAAERASQLTSQLLGFSRRQVIKPITLDVSTAVINSYGMLRRVIGLTIELVMLPAEGLPPVFMDPNQLDQIIMNLVINARDAMPEGGTLTVTASHHQGELYAAHTGDCVVLSVSDTGVGMSEEVKAHLFEPFFTTKNTGKGTGLGLATCYGIVEQNDGYIEVQSELGQGSTFNVYLPVTEEREKSDLDDDNPSVVSSSTPGTETILLVEDEPRVQSMEAIILADQGYVVLQAADGEEALRVCQANQDQEIQLLVTDMVMPRMSGGELITELSSRRPQTKFLVVSGYAEGAIERNVVTRNDVRFMQKPFKPKELADTVREILDGVPEPAV